MDVAAVLIDTFGRIREVVGEVLDGMSDEALAYRPDADANSICWLVWHLTRLQDDHVADVAGTEQVYTAEGWHDRFGFPFDPTSIGYGHTTDEVAQVRAGADLLRQYHEAVYARTVDYVRGLGADDLDRVVDTRWDPPVTLGVRLVSVITDDLQHAGQAAYVRGLIQRRAGGAG